jgi:hypothetical protein
MKWIKVTDRLPDLSIVNTYFVKQREKNTSEDWFPQVCTFSGDWEISDDYEIIEWLDEKENEKDTAYRAWIAAANAFRMYPDNKHTFSDYWETAKQKT